MGYICTFDQNGCLAIQTAIYYSETLAFIIYISGIFDRVACKVILVVIGSQFGCICLKIVINSKIKYRVKGTPVVESLKFVIHADKTRFAGINICG